MGRRSRQMQTTDDIGIEPKRKARNLNPKYQDDRLDKAKPILAKNENQKEYIHSLMTNVITVGRGSAGTGKTYVAACVAANKYLKGEIDKIVITRPLVGMGKSSGFWPGTITDKLEPYLLPIINTLKERIGEDKFRADYGKNITIQPMEAVRGMNFDNVFLIVDEAQNCEPLEIRSLVTRLAEGSQAAFCGDDKQMDLKGLSGIKYLCNLIKNHNIQNCGVVEFGPSDIVRSGITKVFVEIFDAEGVVPR